MKKKWNVIAALLLAVVLVLPLAPKAAAAEKQTVDPAKDTGSISLTLKGDAGAAKDVEITLYQVGKGTVVNNNLVFELVDGLRDAELENPVELNGLTAEENIANAAALKAAIEKLQNTQTGDVVPTWSDKTNDEGVVTFTGLRVGVYLVVQTSRSSVYNSITSFLMYLPMTNEDGTAWEFAEMASPKLQRSSSGGDGGGKEPELPPEVLPDPEVPLGPVEPVEPVEPEEPEEPEEPGEEIPDPEVPLAQLPQTGMLQWPVPVLALVGILLFSTGWMMDQKGRKAREV